LIQNEEEIHTGFIAVLFEEIYNTDLEAKTQIYSTGPY